MIQVPYVPQLMPAVQDRVTVLIRQVQKKQARNRLRRQYFDYKNVLKDLGIALPPSMRSVETVIGWSAKGVEGLVKRAVLDGFVTQSEAVEASVGEIWDANRLSVESRMAHTDAAVASCAFGFTVRGDVEAGEPESMILLRSAEWATGTWDNRRRGLSDALSVTDMDKYGNITGFILYLPSQVVVCNKSGARWDVRAYDEELGMPAEVLPHKPSLMRPFGKSRISRAVMSLTDSGVRTLLRSEVSAEFFSSPQRYLLGADESTFIDQDGNPIPAWQSIIGRILAIGRDENSELPQVGQFTQQSFEPHFQQIRQLASLVASEFNMMPRSFGIMNDNPESAEAISEAKEDLVLDAQEFNQTVSPAWKRLMMNGLRIQDDSETARAEYQRIRPHFKNPALPSVVSASDAVVKQVSALPWLAETREVLEMLGHDKETVDSLLAQKRRAGTSQLIERLRGGDVSANSDPGAPAATIATEVAS